MKRLGLFAVGLACLAMPLVAFADAAKTDAAPLDAEAAFEAMKSLEGTWKGEAITVAVGKTKEEGVKSNSTVTYEVIANESSVVATYGQGTPMEMVSLFHMDGPEALVHTHYCAVGNQPTMRFEKSEKPGEIVFLFSNGANMDVNKDGHVHNSRIRFVDEDTTESETDIWQNGKLSAVRYSTMKREK